LLFFMTIWIYCISRSNLQFNYKNIHYKNIQAYNMLFIITCIYNIIFCYIYQAHYKFIFKFLSFHRLILCNLILIELRFHTSEYLFLLVILLFSRPTLFLRAPGLLVRDSFGVFVVTSLQSLYQLHYFGG
jgi:hypothetical protein